MGAQAPPGRRQASPELIRETLGYLADRVAGRLRKANVAGRTVTVRVRFADMRAVTRSVTLSVPLSTTRTLTEVADQLAQSALADNPGEREISLLAVAVQNLRPEHSLQLELPLSPLERRTTAGNTVRRPEFAVEAGRWGVDRSIDAIREKFGRTAVGYATTALSDAERVPEEFRELAERGPD
jgi:DNA polymerase-4